MSEKQSPGESLKLLFSKMEDFVTTKTVIGEPIHMGETTIIPLVDVSFGMATGVSSTDGEKSKDGGAGGMGAKMSPAAVLVVSGDTVQLVNVKNQESVNKLIDLIPGALAKIGSMFGKKDDEVVEEE